MSICAHFFWDIIISSCLHLKALGSAFIIYLRDLALLVLGGCSLQVFCDFLSVGGDCGPGKAGVGSLFPIAELN